MSTRCTLLYSTNTGNHIYEETADPVVKDGKCIAWNIYGALTFNDELKGIHLQNNEMVLLFVKDCFFDYIFNDGLNIPLNDFRFFEADEEGIDFSIKGDSNTAKVLHEAKKRADAIPEKPPPNTIKTVGILYDRPDADGDVIVKGAIRGIRHGTY